MDKLISAEERIFGMELSVLIKRAGRFLMHIHGDQALIPDAEKGLRVQLYSMLKNETDPQRKHDLEGFLNRFNTYFSRADPDNPASNNGIAVVDVAADGLHAYVTLISPRGIGNVPTINTVMELLDEKRVIFGINQDVLNVALASVRANADIVWRVCVATGEPATVPGPRKARFNVNAIDKTVLRENPALVVSAFKTLWEPVKEKQKIGYLLEPEPGRPGRNVYGKLLAPPAPPPIELGEDVASTPDGTITSKANGYVIMDRDRIDIVPLYVRSESSGAPGEDLVFPGCVVVQGNLSGPATIECDDLFVTGNCEQVKINSRDDVFIGGGIVGHMTSEVQADGGVFCSFVSEAKVSALGPVVVANAIINSEVLSGQTITITSAKGMIAGGKLYALRGITSATIGSEFGMMTEVVVGKDFLTSSRLGEITRRIQIHEENLSRILKLKDEIARSRVPIESMPKEKQDIYIGILRKEQSYRTELNSLMRRRDNLRRGLGEFVSASINVLNSIYPPSRVQILDAISEIKQKLNSVVLKHGKQGVVMSDMSIQTQQEKINEAT